MMDNGPSETIGPMVGPGPSSADGARALRLGGERQGSRGSPEKS